MTLPTSGAISLGNIQTEFGGSNPISMSEYRRGAGSPILVPDTATNANIKSTLSNMSFSNYRGGSVVSTLDTQTVNVGYGFVNLGYGDVFEQYGFANPGAGGGTLGSCTDATSDLYGGAAITTLAYDQTGGTNGVAFELQGSRANSGWTNMIVNGTTYTRASATYNNTGAYTSWRWDFSGNPFGTITGVNKTVTWN